MCSSDLYPWANKEGEYPVGHPQVIVNPDDQDIHHYFGMAKVDMLPPHELYHPVLPFRHGGKLTFPLCRSCVEHEMNKPLLEKSHHCPHTTEQRTLRGTWCTPEIQKAVAMGYTLNKIHEVHHFPPEQRRKGLFADYVNTWLKIKQESTGYPNWCNNPRRQGTVRATIPTERRHRSRSDHDPEKSRTQSHRQTHAQLLLGQVR